MSESGHSQHSGARLQAQPDNPSVSGRKLILFDANFDSLYGAQRSMLGIADQLREFAQVELVTSGDGALRNAAEAQGLRVHVLQASRRINTFGGGIRSFGPFKLLRTAWDVLTYNLRFASLLRRQGATWVVANDLRSLLLTAVGARIRRTPVIWYVRDDMRQGFLHGVGARLANRVVTVSDGVRSVFTEAELKRLQGRLTTIYTGIPSDAGAHAHASGTADPSSKPLVITTVGMLTPRKGQLTFIAIAKELSAGSSRPIRFQIVGSAPDGYGDYEAKVAEAVSNAHLKSGDSLGLLGWRDDVADILQDTDILLHPSTGEGLPRILLEALANRVAVVTYAVSGADEIVPDEDYGYVVPVGAADAMQAAAARLIDDAGLLSAIQQRGPERIAREFTVERAQEQLTGLLLSLQDKDAGNG